MQAAGEQQAPQGQALPHGGAGPVQAEKRNLKVPQAEGGADALVQQVPGQDVVQFRRGQPALFQGPGQGLLLHGGLRLLPGVLSEEGIRAQQVKMLRQGAVGLEFSADVGIGHHAGGPQQGHRLPAQASGRHKNHLLSIVCRAGAGLCEKIRRTVPGGAETEKKKSRNLTVSGLLNGPSVEIRTQGLLNPIQARYQTSPHPDS